MTIRKHRKALARVWREKFARQKKAKVPRKSRELIKELRVNVPDHGLRMRYYNRTIRKKLMGSKHDRKMGYSKLFLTLKRKYRKEMKENGNADVVLTKELQTPPLNFALERAFDMISIHNKTNGAKKLLRKTRVRRIIYKIYKQERISFKGKAKIEFTEKEINDLMKVLGGSGGKEFIELFKKNLAEEAGWARYYIRARIDPASVLAKWQ